MSLDDLTQVVTAPERPAAESEPMAWDEVEARLGSLLPSDYKAYIETFGLGYLDEFLCVFSPFTDNKNLNLFEQLKVRLDALRELKAAYGNEVQYPLFPEEGGLLPWGASDNGDVLFWMTQGQPSEWRVVLNAGRDARCEEYVGEMTTVLAQLLSGAVQSQIFPPDFPSDQPSFEPLD